MGGGECVDDELGEAVGVVMVRDGDLGEVPLRGGRSVLAMEQPEALEREAIVVGRAAADRKGVGPTLEPSDVAELLEAVLDAADAREGLSGKRATQLEELTDRERTAVERLENLHVAVGEVTAC